MPAKPNGIHKVIKCRREWKKYQLEKIMPRTWFHTNGGCLILLRLHEWSETDNYCNNNNKYAAEANLASAFLVMFKKIKPNSRFNRWACVHSELKSCQDLKKIKWRLKIMLIVNINKKKFNDNNKKKKIIVQSGSRLLLFYLEQTRHRSQRDL